jgi:formate dehydrogenase
LGYDIVEKGASGSPAKAATAQGSTFRSRAGRAPGGSSRPSRHHGTPADRRVLWWQADGHVFKGYLPGGASGGILPAALADIPMDFGTLEAEGCFTGSGAVVVLSDNDDMKAVALNLLRFFEDESCGQCTPCRAGTEKAVKLMNVPHWDEPLLQELTQVMSDASICGLGQAAMNPISRC